MSRPPLTLPPTSATPLRVTLILGSFKYSPATIRLFDIKLPASQPAPVHPEEPTFHLLPEIKHTFRPDQKLPPVFISIVFSAVVLAPWVLLIGMVCAILSSVTFATY